MPFEASEPSHKFYWNYRALRVAAWAVAGLTLAVLPAIATQMSIVQALAACWLVLLLMLARSLANRANSPDPVLTIDALGITDRRLRSERIYWQDIASLEHTDLHRSKVIEFHLKQPGKFGAGGSPSLRLGAWLQHRTDLPALTISLLFLDASAADVARAVAEFRPNLLPVGLLEN